MAGPILDAAMARATAMGQQAGSAPSAVSASAPPHESAWPYAVLFGGQAADAGTTLAAIGNGLQEKNPLGVGGMFAMKAAATAALALLMHHEALKGNEHAQKLLGIIGGALGAGPAIWNGVQMAKQK